MAPPDRRLQPAQNRVARVWQSRLAVQPVSSPATATTLARAGATVAARGRTDDLSQPSERNDGGVVGISLLSFDVRHEGWSLLFAGPARRGDAATSTTAAAGGGRYFLNPLAELLPLGRERIRTSENVGLPHVGNRDRGCHSGRFVSQSPVATKGPDIVIRPLPVDTRIVAVESTMRRIDARNREDRRCSRVRPVNRKERRVARCAVRTDPGSAENRR